MRHDALFFCGACPESPSGARGILDSAQGHFTTSMKTRIITCYWNTSHAERQAEIDTAVRRNAEDPAVDEVVLVSGDGALPELHPKFKIVHSPRPRETYASLIALANSLMTSPEDITVILNSDCYFEPGDLGKLRDLAFHQTALTVTRRDAELDGTLMTGFTPWFCGQDAWVFRGRIRPLKWADFQLGRWRCDWVFAWMLRHAGYRLLNPYEDLRLWHLHATGVRHTEYAINPPGEVRAGYVDEVLPARLGSVSFPESTSTGVLSFSLYGQEELYLQGAVANAAMARFLYPGFIPRFYVSEDVPAGTVRRLRDLSCEIVECGISKGHTGAMWRFSALEDLSVHFVCIRDADSRLNLRERQMFDQWVASGRSWHTVRDHPWQRMPICAGLFDSRRPLHLPEQRCQSGAYGEDEGFLAGQLLPLIRHDLAVHDTFGSHSETGVELLPSPPLHTHWNYYCGAKIWPDNGLDPTTWMPLDELKAS